MPSHRPLHAAFPRLFATILLTLGLTLAAFAAAEKKNFDVPAGDALATLKQAAQQGGVQIMYPAATVQGVKTRAVKGEYAPREALDRMLDGTGLAVVQDEKTGALAVRRDAGPNEPRAAQMASDRPSTIEDGRLVLEKYEVTGSRIQQTEVEGFAPLFSLDRAFIENSGFGTTEDLMRMLPQNFTTSVTGRAGVPNDSVPGVRTPGQSGAGLFGLGANNTLVLIDGQRMPLAANSSATSSPPQGFYDINTIPLGMIERIEVLTDGASAIYGSDATGGVINIILKKNFNETELRGRIGGTAHGGAFERGGTITHGFTSGKLQGTIVLDYFNREALFARQRRFSKTADQTGNGGSDFRSTTGSPVRIFALGAGATLNGLLNPNGTPATNAIAPTGRTGKVTVADFAPTAGLALTTRYDTTHLQALIHPTDRRALAANFNYSARPGLTFISQFSYTDDSTDVYNVPQATSSQTGGAATGRIPAANPFNPFGQDLGFILLHEEMGPRLTESDTDTFRALLGATIDLPHQWQAQFNTQFATQRLRTANPILNVPLMQAALNRTDPQTALNLFGDPRAGKANGPGIYEEIFPLTIERSKSDLYTAQLFGRGPVWQLPTGPVQMAAGGEWQQQDRIRTTNVPSLVLPARSRFTRDTWAGFVEASVPVVKPKSRRLFLHSLDLQLAGRYEDIENAGTTVNPKYGVRWQPFKPLLLRASYGTGFRAPSPTEFEQPEISGPQNVFDPRRGVSYSMNVTTGGNLELQPETSETTNFGVVLTVPKVKGLSLGADYSRKEQENLTASFSATAIVANEALFPDRVVRGPQSPTDVVLGMPGLVQTVDASFVNFGFVRVETIDLSLTYDLPWQDWGRFTFRASASHFLTYNLLLTPGATTGEDDLIGTNANFPVKTRGNAYLFWTKGDYGATLLCFYNGGFQQLGSEVASSTTFDLNVSYHWRRFGVRFQGGIGNIFDREPSWVNTALGYQVGSQPGPKQRTYHASVIYSF